MKFNVVSNVFRCILGNGINNRKWFYIISKKIPTKYFPFIATVGLDL